MYCPICFRSEEEGHQKWCPKYKPMRMEDLFPGISKIKINKDEDVQMRETDTLQE